MTDLPKAAAVVVLTDEEQGRVLLVKRSRELRFMPNTWVFPGGKVDAQDRSQLEAAVRELFEESGLLATRGPKMDARQLHVARLELLADRRDFRGILEEFGQQIHEEDFEEAGHWVTPAFSKIRFDTRYYLYRTKQWKHATLHVGEHVELCWLDPGQARQRWRSGEMALSPPVSSTLAMLAREAYPAVLKSLNNTDDKDAGVPERFEFCCGIHCLPLRTQTLPPATHTNCYLIGEEELYILDPGPTDPLEQARLKRHLDLLRTQGRSLKAIILTHTHPDHIGAVAPLVQEYDLSVWAHPACAGELDFRIDRELNDGDLIEIAGDRPWRLRCLHTPGHHPGHLCFHEETGDSLLVGDMVANPGTIIVGADYGGNMDDYLKSLERLCTLKSAVLFPAHGMHVRPGNKLLEETIRHRLWREERVKAALAKGLREIEDLLPVVYEDVPAHALPLAEQSLKAHLIRLGLIS